MTNQNPLLGFILRRYPALLLALLAAAGGAFVAAQQFATQTWTFTATLLYNRSSLGGTYYQQPEVQTVVGLFKSRTVLDRLVRDMKMPPAIKPISDAITAEQQLGSNVVQVTLKTDRPEASVQTLDKLIEIVGDQVVGMRRTTAEQLLDGRRRQLAEARRASETAAANLQSFHAQHGIVTTLNDELQRLRNDILEAERLLETDRPTQLQPSDDLQRQRDLLHTQLLEEREKISRESSLAVKKQDYERAVRLHDKRYISDTEFRRIESEYRALEAQSAAVLQARQEQIDRLDRRLADKLVQTERSGDSGTAANPIDAATTARLQAFLAQRRTEAERMNALRTVADDLQRQVTAAHADVERTLGVVTACEELRDSDFRDLTVLQPPAPSLDPLTSNKKKLLVGCFVGLLIAGCLPIAVVDMWSLWQRQQKSPTPLSTDNLGPTWTTATLAPPATRREAIRAFALRLQQIPADGGAVVSLHGTQSAAAAAELAVDVAECLHRRGERVLVVAMSKDASAAHAFAGRIETNPAPVNIFDDWLAPHSRNSATERTFASTTQAVGESTALATLASAGFSELLIDHESPWSNVVRRSAAFDLLPFGDVELPEEAFASRRLSQLLCEFRRRYGVVLLVGPCCAQRVDLELLAARVDGLAVALSGDEAVPNDVERLLGHLSALRAPVLGTVRI